MKHAKTTALLTTLAALLGACSSTPIAPAAAPVKTAAVAPAQPMAPAPVATPAATQPTARTGEVKTVTLPAYLDPKSEIASARSVYFDFDEAAVKNEFEPLIEKHGKFLATHPQVKVKIEGNTDERGGAEYNLALGQKRAEAVRRELALLGVKDSQMEAISWGEDKPKAQGHDESAWAQNRRADLQYPAR